MNNNDRGKGYVNKQSARMIKGKGKGKEEVKKTISSHTQQTKKQLAESKKTSRVRTFEAQGDHPLGNARFLSQPSAVLGNNQCKKPE